MAKGYKRDSRGRFAGGYGAGALGGKGAYASRPNSGKGSRGSRGAVARLNNPKAVRARRAIGRGAKAYGKTLGKGALVLGGAVAANAAMNRVEKALIGAGRGKGGSPLPGSTTYRGAGAGRIEDLGTRGLTVKQTAFNVANPMTAKYVNPLLTKSNARPSTYSQKMRAARPGR